uniref:Heat shock protein 70 family n=1 Tax=Taenia asiatica TaxID=60517 RepID=A0A0R3WA81_TAEAS
MIEQISSMVLSKMKEIAEAYLDEKVTSAVITVPAYFNVSQRQATIDAENWLVLRLLNEPTAAALAYGMNKRYTSQRNVLVFDWGGGTFDVSIMSIGNGEFEVKAVGGVMHLGGEDITSLLVDHFMETFKRDHEKKDLTTNKTAISRLRKECKEAKRMLSSAENTYITVASLFEGIEFNTSLTRARFEHLCSNLLNRTMDAVKTALNYAKMEKADVHEIFLVGGSTRIPKVGMMLQDFFEGKGVKRSINADEAVAYGAAMLAANLTGQGPAEMQDLISLEVTPLSLGLHDSWGERARACDNHLLGAFVLAGLPPAPRGKIKVDVAFGIDENGILRVSAVEKSTGKRNSIIITNYKHRLSENEIDQRSKDEENLKKEAEEERSRVAAMKSLVNYIYSMKRMLEKEDIKRKTSKEYRESILAKFVETIRWLDTNEEATKEDYKQMHKMLESECSLITELAGLSL